MQTAQINPAMTMAATQTTGNPTATPNGDFAAMFMAMMGQQGGELTGMEGLLDGDMTQLAGQLFSEEENDPNSTGNAMEMMAAMFMGMPAGINFVESPMSYSDGGAAAQSVTAGTAQTAMTAEQLMASMEQIMMQGEQQATGQMTSEEAILASIQMSQNQQTMQTAQGEQASQTKQTSQAVTLAVGQEKQTTQPLPLLGEQASSAEITDLLNGKITGNSTLEALSRIDPKVAAELIKSGQVLTDGTAKQPQQQFIDPMQSAYAKINKSVTAVTQASQKPTAEADIEALQQAVDNGTYMPQSMTALKDTSATSQPHTMNILQQVQTGIMGNLGGGGNKEFTIKLSPRGLGDITVKMVENDGKISLSITTSTQQAQNALSTELGSLREALKPYNAEIQQIVQNDTGAFQQSMTEHRHGQQGEQPQSGQNHYGTDYFHDAEAEAPVEIQREYAALRANGLNAYI